MKCSRIHSIWSNRTYDCCFISCLLFIAVNGSPL